MPIPVATTVEPILPPDTRRPERTPSWPAWVALRLASLKEELQLDETGKHRRLPTWAVAAAARRWFRGDAGNDEHGKPYDYSWCPAPADLRRVAMRDVVVIRNRAKQLRQLIAARPRAEYSEEHCAAMRARIRDLFKSLGTSLVGSNGSGEAANVASAERATVGRDHSTAPA